MRASKTVTLAAVPLLAAAFLGCEDDDTAYCVNPQNEVVENRFCEDTSTHGGFFWLYGGRALGGGSIARGTVLDGGERIRANDSAAIARRGGFGSSAGANGIGRPTGSSSGG